MHRPTMKKLMLAAALTAVAAVSPRAMAVDWTPPGPIKMMIGFEAGGEPDTQARMIAEELEARHGWKIIPEQMTGEGGTVLAAALKDEPADGTAIGMLVTESLGYNMLAAKNAGYRQSDFTPLTTTAAVAGFRMGVVAHISRGWKTFDDMIATGKDGREIRFGATSPKLAALAYLLGKEHGVDFNVVMFRDDKGVMNRLNAGDLDAGWGAGIQNKAVLAGDMVHLVSGLSTRLTVSPEAPTMEELGVDFNADEYFMFAAPAGLPDEAREALSSAIAAVVTDGGTKASGFIEKAFGCAVVIQGAELDALLAVNEAAAAALMQTAYPGLVAEPGRFPWLERRTGRGTGLPLGMWQRVAAEARGRWERLAARGGRGDPGKHCSQPGLLLSR